MESLGEIGSSPRNDRMRARCKVPGAGQDRPISFHRPPLASGPSTGVETSTPAADC